MILAVALALLSATSTQAQHGSGTVDSAGKECGCTMMSDTAIIWLGLVRDQVWEIGQSHARCLNACAKGQLNPFGNPNPKAVAKHDKELRRILTDTQYAEWMELRNKSTFRDPLAQPRTY